MVKGKGQNKNGLNSSKQIIFYFLILIFILLLVGSLFYFHHYSQRSVIEKIQHSIASGEVVDVNFFIERSRSFIVIAGLVFFSFLALIIFFFYFVYRRLLKPLAFLKEGINKIKDGDVDYKIEIDQEGELKDLADFINERNKSSQEANFNLESNIKQRTGDLDKVVAKLWNKNLEMKDSETAMINLLEDSRLLEGQLKQEKDRMNTIISCMDEGLIVVDTKGSITFVNPAAERLLEIKKETAIGKNLEYVVPLFIGRDCEKKVGAEDRPLIKAMRTGKAMVTSLADDYYFLSTSGERFAIIEASSPLLKEDEIIGGLVTFRNVNIEKRLDESKNGFISIASHQMRTPLTSMRWFAEMLISGDAGAINKEQKKFMERIHEGIERLIALLNLLLQIARVEAGRVKIAPAPIVFKNVIDGVALALGPSIRAKRQKIKIILKPINFPAIPMDQEVIWQVFLNLISNACRYAPDKGEITITGEKKGDLVEFSVADKGIGIPKDSQGRVFKKFFRAENAMKLVPEGSGLGLSLVKSLVEGWEGKIWFTSKVGKGTTMYFTVPLSGMKKKEGDVSLKV